MISAGTGIQHSEYNRNSEKEVHFLQIWIQPNISGLNPKYYIRHFSDVEKTDRLVHIVAPLSSSPYVPVVHERYGSGPAPIHAGTSVFASILSPSKTVAHIFPTPAPGESTRKSYLHVIQTSGYNIERARGARVKINGKLELAEGDGTYAMGIAGDKLEITNIGDINVEFLIFDIE